MQDIYIKDRKTSNETALKIECRVCEIQEITKILGINPTVVCRREKEDRVSAEAIWVYSTGKKEGLCTDSQIKELEDIFSSKVHLIRKLKERYFLRISVDVTSEIIRGETPGLVFENSFLKMLAKMGAEINVILQVHSEKMDVSKADFMIGQEDIRSLAEYAYHLPEEEAAKLVEYLLSYFDTLSADAKAGKMWNTLNTQNAEELLNSLLDIYCFACE